MDNFHLSMASDRDIIVPIKIIMDHSKRLIRGYVEREEGTERSLVLFDTPAVKDETEFTPIPFDADAEFAAQFVEKWLAKRPYPHRPDEKDWFYSAGWWISTGPDDPWNVAFRCGPQWMVQKK